MASVTSVSNVLDHWNYKTCLSASHRKI